MPLWANQQNMLLIYVAFWSVLTSLAKCILDSIVFITSHAIQNCWKNPEDPHAVVIEIKAWH